VLRGWFIAAIAIGVGAIVIAAVAMRLSDNGSSDANPSTTDWASSVCSDLATWKSSVSSLADVQTLNAATLNQKIEDAQTATSTLVDQLEALGPPDLQSGDQLRQDLTTSTDQLRSTFDSMKETAQQATQGGSLSIPALAPLAPQFQQLLQEASTIVKTLENANVVSDAKSELQSAFSDAESCQQLRGNG
jgi:hypothetical protein